MIVFVFGRCNAREPTTISYQIQNLIALGSHFYRTRCCAALQPLLSLLQPVAVLHFDTLRRFCHCFNPSPSCALAPFVAQLVTAPRCALAPLSLQRDGVLLGDLASNLGIGCPLARVTGWAKKVGSIKVF